jgi:FtsH-binding integral membrane protein
MSSLLSITQTTKADFAGKGFLSSIYLYMVGGLLVSATAAYITLTNESILRAIVGNSLLLYGIIGIEIGLALYVQWMIQKSSPLTSGLLFVVYSILNGITISLLLLVYTATSAAMIFALAAAMYLVLALLGHYEVVDISSWGGFLAMSTFGILAAAFLNMWMQSPVFNTIISMVSMIVFSLLTIFDARHYKDMESQITDGTTRQRMIVLGALHMYMNFIVLFTSLLNLFGNRE